MNEEFLKQLEGKLAETVDSVMENRLKESVGPMVAENVKSIVEKMRLDRALTGKDITGLNEEQKNNFVGMVKAVVGMKTKANEALIAEQDDRGGYLVPVEVADAIVRIAASVGLVMSQAQQWPMGTDEKDIPAYTGSFLEGEYLGVDVSGSVTALNFAQAKLVAKKWQVAFVMGNDLLADANVALADWLLALAGEALANRVDKEGLAGTSAPFVGVLNHASVPTYTLPSGETGFASFRVIEDASDVVAQLEESVLEGAAWYMHRTVWAKLRSQKSSSGDYLLPMAGAVSNGVLANLPTGGGRKPVGELLGFPVYTSRHLPAYSASAVSTKFIVFGNMKALAFGQRSSSMSMEEFRSGSFGGKEIATADQRAIVLKHRHAVVPALPSAFVTVKTAAS